MPASAVIVAPAKDNTQHLHDWHAGMPPQRMSLRKVMFGHAGKFTLQKIATDHPKGTEVLLRGKLDTKNRRGVRSPQQHLAHKHRGGKSS